MAKNTVVDPNTIFVVFALPTEDDEDDMRHGDGFDVDRMFVGCYRTVDAALATIKNELSDDEKIQKKKKGKKISIDIFDTDADCVMRSYVIKQTSIQN